MLACVFVIVVAGGAWWGGVTVYRHQVFGTVLTESQLNETVAVGDRFSLAVPDRGASAGDAWSAAAVPDNVLTGRGRRTWPHSLLDRFGSPGRGGGRGMSYFLYDAKSAGTVKVALTDCFQGCDHPTDQTQSRTVTWTITVY